MKKKPEPAAPERTAFVGKTKKSTETRQRILDAAALSLNRRGAGLTSLQDLGDEINLRAASIYYHFPSKDALIEEVLRIGIENVHYAVREAVDALEPGVTSRQRIETAMAAHLSSLLSHGVYSSANLRNFPLVTDEIRERNRGVRRAYGDYWKHLLTQAQDAGEIGGHVDLTLIRLLLMGALNWATEWFNPARMSIEDIAASTCAMLFDGVKPGAGAKAPPSKAVVRKSTSSRRAK